MINAGGVFGRNPKFNNVTIDGDLTVNGDSVAFKSYEVDTLEVNSANASTSTTTGAAVITGGVGIGGALHVGGNVVLSSGNGIDFSATANGGSAAVAAQGGITRTATNVSDSDTVTVGASVYTFKTALTPADGEVLIGADSTASLLNLACAINNSGGTPGTDYQVAAANASATAGTAVGTLLPLTAITAGTAGNSITLSDTAAELTVTAFANGAAATSASSELLSDYEEGTWTPSLRFGGNSVGMVYTTRLGQYRKIGKVVHCQADIRYSAKGTSTGTAGLTGLPFVNGFRFPDAYVAAAGVTTNNGIRMFVDGTGTTVGTFYEINNAGTYASLASSAFGATFSMAINLTYHTTT